MNDETLTALKESIEHWKKNAADPENATIGSTNCSLCKIYFDSGCELDEVRCPVFEFTGHQECVTTPYSPAIYAIKAFKEGTERNQQAIQKEVEFLESLLPKGE